MLSTLQDTSELVPGGGISLMTQDAEVTPALQHEFIITQIWWLRTKTTCCLSFCAYVNLLCCVVRISTVPSWHGSSSSSTDP
jgi:hypothetical protein